MGIEENDLLTTASGWIRDYFPGIGAGRGGVVRLGGRCYRRWLRPLPGRGCGPCSDCEWEDVYSAYYDCEDDGTVTFYEGESAEAGNPGIWTSMVYDCTAAEEEVVTNVTINTLDPVLELRQLAGV